MIIGEIPNKKYGKKAPSEYLNNSPLNENPYLQECLSSHQIIYPDKLIKGDYDSDFKTFLEDRYISIKDLIDTEIESVRKRMLEDLNDLDSPESINP
jgi:hypothetical protein